jgi:hypothetical protein
MDPCLEGPAFATGDDEWVAETANQNWKNKDVKNG